MPNIAELSSTQTQPLYDTVRLNPGAVATTAGQQFTFFTIPKGQGLSPSTGVGAKTFLDTNLEVPSQLPSPCNFLIYGITVQPDPACTYPDLQAFLTVCWVELTIGQMPWWRSPVIGLPQACGISGPANVVPGAGFLGLTSGIPDPRAMMALSQLIPIKQGEPFSMTLTTAAILTFSAAAQSVVRIWLHGEYTRAVQ